MKRYFDGLRAAAIVALLFSASCSAYEIQAREPPDLSVAALPQNAGRICVIRPHAVAALAPAVVRDNGRLVGMTKGPSYFCYLAEAGFHSIVSRYGDDIDRDLDTDDIAKETINVGPGGRYFLHHDVTKIMTLSVEWVNPADAESMIRECEYAELVAAPKGEVLPQPGEVVRAGAAPMR